MRIKFSPTLFILATQSQKTIMSAVYLSSVDSNSKLNSYTGLPVLNQNDGLSASKSTPLLLEWSPVSKRKRHNQNPLLEGVLLKNASMFPNGTSLAQGEGSNPTSRIASLSLTYLDEVDGQGGEEDDEEGGGRESPFHSSFGELLQTRDSKLDLESQKLTFTNWLNDRLKAGRQGPKVTDLSEDLQDGILLIRLLENLTKKKIRGYTKNPKMPAHKLDNLELAIDFMKNEDLKLIGIGSVNIFEGNMKLTLGMLWTLIQKYQLRIQGSKVSTKDVMLQWLQALISSWNITNFTSDWSDGRALLALINAVKPGTAHSATTMDPTKHLGNCTLATQLAEVHLKVPKIINAESLARGNIDELSMLTYLSYFVEPAQGKLRKWVKRALPHANITNFTTNWFDGVLFSALLNLCFPGTLSQCAKMTKENANQNVREFFDTCKKKLNFEPRFSTEDLTAGRVEELQVMTAILHIQNGKLQSMPESVVVSGNGLEIAKIGKENSFTINTTEAGPGKLSVDAYYEDGRKLKFKLKEKIGGVLTLSYMSPTQGRLVFDIQWANVPIPDSPFSVLALTPSMVHILDFKNHVMMRDVGREIELTLGVKQATRVSTITAHLSYGKGEKVEAKVIALEESAVLLKYTPTRAGSAILRVFLNKKELSHLSVTYTIVDSGGYQIESLPEKSFYETFEEVEFIVDSTKNLSLAVLKMTAVLTDDIQFPFSFNSTEGSRGYASFKPTLPGEYKVEVTCVGCAIQGTPFYVQVTDPMHCKLQGSLPSYLDINKPHVFELDTNTTKVESIAFECVEMESSSSFQVLCNRTEEDHFTQLTVIPVAEGEFVAGIKFQNQWISGCPFRLVVCDPSKFRIRDNLVNKRSVVGETIQFSVESMRREAIGNSLVPTVTANGPTAKYTPKYHSSEDRRALIFHFTPYEVGIHEVSVTYGGFPVPSSPVSIDVIAYDSHTFSATGSGLQEAYTNIPGQFIVLTKRTGLAQNGILQVKVAGVINGKECSMRIKDNDNGSYNAEYLITHPGAYLITIQAGGIHIPGSPFKLTALPGPNPQKCKMFGPALNDTEIFTLGQSIDFTVDATKGGVGKLVTKAVGPDGVPARVFVAKDSSSKGMYDIKLDPVRHGKYSVNVKWSGTNIPGSPFTVNVFPGVDASKCRAYGPGLENGCVGHLTEFYIETQNAGPGDLNVDIHGVQDAFKIDIKPKDMIDIRTLVARYFPRKPGNFIISIMWSEKHIPGSPFKVKITGEAMDDAFRPNKYKPFPRNDDLESIVEAEDEEDTLSDFDMDFDFDVSSVASKVLESKPITQKVSSVKSLNAMGMPSFQRTGFQKGFQETFVHAKGAHMMSKSLTHIAKNSKAAAKPAKKVRKRKKAAASKTAGPKSGFLK